MHPSPEQIKYPQLDWLPPLLPPTQSWQSQYFLLSSHRLNHATLTLPHLVFMEWHSLLQQVCSCLFWDVLVHNKTVPLVECPFLKLFSFHGQTNFLWKFLCIFNSLTKAAIPLYSKLRSKPSKGGRLTAKVTDHPDKKPLFSWTIFCLF